MEKSIDHVLNTDDTCQYLIGLIMVSRRQGESGRPRTTCRQTVEKESKRWDGDFGAKQSLSYPENRCAEENDLQSMND